MEGNTDEATTAKFPLDKRNINENNAYATFYRLFCRATCVNLNVNNIHSSL